jgi:hypothetical protein
VKKTSAFLAIGTSITCLLSFPSTLPRAQAQALSVAALIAGADKVVADLNTLISNAGDQVRATTGDLSTEINGLEEQIKSDVSDPSKSITNVGANAQNSVNTLQYIVQNAGDLLSKQRACLDVDINLLEAGLRTTLEQAKSGVPFVGTSGARLDQFVFVGHTPNVVPSSGGPLTLRGFKLWQNRPPVVTLIADPANVDPIVTLVANRQTDNDVTTNIPPAVITAHAGECLYLRISARHPAILGIGTSSGETSAMPFCIPDTALTEYQMATTVKYFCAGQTTSVYTSPAQNVSYPRCEGGNVPVGGNFPVPVPPHCSVIGAQAIKGNLTVNEASTTRVGISGQTVVLSSLLAPASCSGPWNHLSRASDWQYWVTATISCTTSSPANALNARSPWIAATDTQTPLAVDTTPKSCAPEHNTSDVSVQVFRIVRGRSANQVAAVPANLVATYNGATLASMGQILAGGAGIMPTAPQIGTKIYDEGGSEPGGSTLVLPTSDYGSTTTKAKFAPGSDSQPAHVSATVKVNSCGY